MTYTELIERGIVVIDDEYPDYVGVAIGPNDDEGTCVAIGYVHTESVTVSVNLEEDTVQEVTRWFAYDATHTSPGSPVGRRNGGYATKEEALVALVNEFEGELIESGFPIDDGRETMAEVVSKEPWDAPEVAACPYLGDDEFPIVVCIHTGERRDTLTDDVARAMDGLLGEWHPEVLRRARLAGGHMTERILQFFPTLWDAGIDPVIDIRAEVSVDSYGNTWLDDGDPFKALDIRVYYAVYDDRYDRKDRRHIKAHGSLEFDVYEPEEGDSEQIVHVVAGSGRNCVATNEMGMFIESGSSDASTDEDIIRSVDESFFKFLSSVSSALLRGMLDGDESDGEITEESDGDGGADGNATEA